MLPPTLATFKETVAKVLDGYSKDAGDKLSVEFIDPDAGDGAVAKQIKQQYGFRPMAASLFDTNTFYFYLTLDGGASTVVQIPLPEDLTEEGLKRSLDAGVQTLCNRLSEVGCVDGAGNAGLYAEHGRRR